MRNLAHQTFSLVVVVSLMALGGCGGGSSSTPQTYTVGVSVKGLASGERVTLLDNRGDTLIVSAAGEYTFATALGSGAAYSVTVRTQPTGQTCAVTQGSGTVASQSLTNVAVTCADNTYTVGGEITGLGSAPGLVLVNGSDTLSVAAGATSFTMPTAVAYGSSYDITVRAHPPALNCTVTGGAGTMSAATVTSISISCAAGTVSALYSFDGIPDASGPFGSLIQASDGSFYGTTLGGGASGAGAVFKITPDGTESVLYSFGGGTTDGQEPFGNLVQGSDGNFYATTDTGGPSNAGVVFKITPAGSESVLHFFGATATDGANPYGNLVQTSDGPFYGLTTSGGAYSHGTVFEITAAGTETVLYSFAGAPADGASPYGSLIQASDGNFYGMTARGGANDDGTIFRITPSGIETVLYSFAGGTGDGAYPYGSLIQASDGNFYGMTEGGGAQSLGTVFRMAPGGTETILHSFAGTAAADGANPQGSLIQASDGNLYGVTQLGGAYSLGAIFEITPTGTVSVLYSFSGAYGGKADGFGSLIQTSDGDFYGLALGGTYNHGEVFMLN